MSKTPRSTPSLFERIHGALQLDFFTELLGSTPEKTPPASPNNSATPRRQILLQSQLLEYELRRSKRRSIGFLIGDEGLRITAPRWVTLADIERAIHEKQGWIFAKLHEKQAQLRQGIQQAMKWEDGAQLPYLGQHLVLRLSAAPRSSVQHDVDHQLLQVCLPPQASEQQLKDRVQSWLQKQALQLFNERLDHFAEQLGVRYHSLKLSSANTRWGSCTAQGHIRLNWRLIHFSPAIIDYVVAHELSHLREMNHSADFWATVESILPDYHLAKQQLRQQSARHLPQF